jgi:uncharacterized protein YijF (DUF1287 family)
MEKKNNFGEIASKNIKIGDIVAWSRWETSISDWREHLGVVSSVEEKEV